MTRKTTRFFNENESSLSEFNRLIPEREYGGIYGTFFVCGIGEENFISLTLEQMKTYKKRFQGAEMILAVNEGKPEIAKIDAIPKQPPNKPKRPKRKQR